MNVGWGGMRMCFCASGVTCIKVGIPRVYADKDTSRGKRLPYAKSKETPWICGNGAKEKGANGIGGFQLPFYGGVRGIHRGGKIRGPVPAQVQRRTKMRGIPESFHLVKAVRHIRQDAI